MKPVKRTAAIAAAFAAVVSFGVVITAQQPGAAPAGRGRGAQTPPPPAPAPGSAGTYLNNDDLQAALKRSMANAGGDMSSSAVANTDQYRINIVHREKPAGAISHAGNTELHYIIDGAATIVTGGTIVRPTGGNANAAIIEHGETRHMKKGDIIIVPAGSPHWYKDIEGAVTYLEVRFVAPTK